MKSSFVVLPALASAVYGHGFVTTPKARMPGTAMSSACGEQVYNNQKSDNYGNVQGELQVAQSQSDYKAAECDIWLCKGYKFADNKDNVQTYTPGQKVSMVVDVRAPHTGVANVSIVDTASNSVIGSALKSWDVYASTETGVKDTDKNFDITIPSDLGSKCGTAGDCVIQWYWYAESIDQTYESCVDFTVSGSGSGSSTGSSASSGTSPSAVAANVVSTPSASKSACSKKAKRTASAGESRNHPRDFMA
ncbi:chitin binding domain-containing protein [Phyllosticta citriasiana]|uniref:Chitin binding domain-containing protein n=1 Tax=Phyllosticta citriasiana TaxID=595635 RepID=A0ABR1L051_9PEZI